ncbi:MAG: putative HNHc nuclease [Anaerotignaceae bacterium]
MIRQGLLIGFSGENLVIQTQENSREEIMAKKINRVEIRFDDGRTITADQRKKAYAIIGEISRWSGYLPEEAKEWLKFYFTAIYGQLEYFSLSDCSVTTAREFISYLIDFCLKHDVPCRDSLKDLTDDIGRYLYSCLVNKRCCICGKPADFHHCEGSRVGMGRDRTEVPLLGVDGMALCREHHTECHTIGEETFCNKHHVYGLKIDDELLEKMKNKE